MIKKQHLWKEDEEVEEDCVNEHHPENILIMIKIFMMNLQKKKNTNIENVKRTIAVLKMFHNLNRSSFRVVLTQ